MHKQIFAASVFESGLYSQILVRVGSTERFVRKAHALISGWRDVFVYYVNVHTSTH